MPDTSILDAILKELKLQKRYGRMPDHLVAAVGVVTQGAGKAMDRAMLVKYGHIRAEREAARKELKAALVETAANAIWLLEALQDHTDPVEKYAQKTTENIPS